MKIAMIGQKGLPATHGGVERHVEELARRLVDRGHEVTVFTRPNYSDPAVRSYEGIRLVSLPTVGTKHLDAIVHSFVSSMATWGGGFDVVHYHAIGPCLTSPLARLRGRKVVATVHGQDWRRGKWGAAASRVLRLAEWMALTVPNATISVSETLADIYGARGKSVHYIPNGIAIPEGDDTAILTELGIRDGEYVLFAGRLVPEKGLDHLFEAYRLAEGSLPPLVVAGDASGSDDYVARVREEAPGDAVFAGYVYGARLAALFRHAALFVLPSDLEGLPIVLLEALAYGCPVLASDIAPNVEVLGDNGTYFAQADAEDLRGRLAEALRDVDALRSRAAELQASAVAEYDWEDVTTRTERVYSAVCGGTPGGT